MNSYELSRAWFDFCFDNPERISPNHTAIFMFAIEHCNRLGWKKKFGFPSQMTMDAIGIKKHQTYIKYFLDLVDWKFFTLLERSTNQYSANIISLNLVTKNGKALDKAFMTHAAKQTGSNGQSNGQSNSSIDKQYNQEQINQLTKNHKEVKVFLESLIKHGDVKDVFTFDEFWELYADKKDRSKCVSIYAKINQTDRAKIKETLHLFKSHKPFENYTHPNPSTYLRNRRWDDEIKADTKELSVLMSRWDNIDDIEKRRAYSMCLQIPITERTDRQKTLLTKTEYDPNS